MISDADESQSAARLSYVGDASTTRPLGVRYSHCFPGSIFKGTIDDNSC